MPKELNHCFGVSCDNWVNVTPNLCNYWLHLSNTKIPPEIKNEKVQLHTCVMHLAMFVYLYVYLPADNLPYCRTQQFNDFCAHSWLCSQGPWLQWFSNLKYLFYNVVPCDPIIKLRLLYFQQSLHLYYVANGMQYTVGQSVWLKTRHS